MASRKKEPPKTAIGIDFGSSKCCVGLVRDGKVEILENERGNKTTPSYVAFTEAERLVGESALDQVALNPTNTVFGAKRLLGRKGETQKTTMELARHLPYDVTQENVGVRIKVAYKGNQRKLSPEQIAAMLLSQMKQLAEKHLCCPVLNAVIAVPAHFTNAQRRALKDAGTIAGLTVLGLISETTAAAVAYQDGKTFSKKQNVLVVDIGEGAFNAAVVEVQDASVEVKAICGTTNLSGGELDRVLVEHLADRFTKLNKVDVKGNKKAFQRLKTACQKAKHTLTLLPETVVQVDCLVGEMDFSDMITRTEFNGKFLSAAQETIGKVLRNVLSDARLNPPEIDEVVLIGGSTRVPAVQEALVKFFAGKRLNKTVNPDEAVAHGAALQAAILVGDNSVTEVRVTDIVKNPVDYTERLKKQKPFVSIKTIKIPRSPNSYVVYGERIGRNKKHKLEHVVDSFGVYNPRGNPEAIKNQTKTHVDVMKINWYLTEDEILVMKGGVQFFDDEDRNYNRVLNAVSVLEALCFKVKGRFPPLKNSERGASDGPVSKRTKALTNCEECLEWLQKHETAPAKTYREKTQILQNLFAAAETEMMAKSVNVSGHKKESNESSDIIKAEASGSVPPKVQMSDLRRVQAGHDVTLAKEVAATEVEYSDPMTNGELEQPVDYLKTENEIINEHESNTSLHFNEESVPANDSNSPPHNKLKEKNSTTVKRGAHTAESFNRECANSKHTANGQVVTLLETVLDASTGMDLNDETDAADHDTAQAQDTRSADDEAAKPQDTQSADDEAAQAQDTRTADDEAADLQDTQSADDEAATKQNKQPADDEAATPQVTQSADEEARKPQDTPSADDEAVKPQDTRSADDEAVKPQDTQSADDEAATPQVTQSADEEARKPQDTPSADDEAVKPQDTRSADDEAVKLQDTQSADDEAANLQNTQSADDKAVKLQDTQSADDEAAKPQETRPADDEPAKPQEGTAADDEAAKLQEVTATDDEAAEPQEGTAADDETAKPQGVTAADDEAAKEQEVTAADDEAAKALEVTAIGVEAAKALEVTAADDEAAKAQEVTAIGVEAAKALEVTAIGDEAAKALEVTAADDEAAKALEVTAIGDEAAIAQEFTAIGVKAAKALEVTAIGVESAKVLEVTAADDEAAKAQEVTAIDVEAAKALEVTAIGVEAAKALEVTAIGDETAKPQEVTAADDEAAKPQVVTAADDEAAKALEVTAIGVEAAKALEVTAIGVKAAKRQETVVIANGQSLAAANDASKPQDIPAAENGTPRLQQMLSASKESYSQLDESRLVQANYQTENSPLEPWPSSSKLDSLVDGEYLSEAAALQGQLINGTTVGYSIGTSIQGLAVTVTPGESIGRAGHQEQQGQMQRNELSQEACEYPSHNPTALDTQTQNGFQQINGNEKLVISSGDVLQNRISPVANAYSDQISGTVTELKEGNKNHNNPHEQTGFTISRHLQSSPVHTTILRNRRGTSARGGQSLHSTRGHSNGRYPPPLPEIPRQGGSARSQNFNDSVHPRGEEQHNYQLRTFSNSRGRGQGMGRNSRDGWSPYLAYGHHGTDISGDGWLGAAQPRHFYDEALQFWQEVYEEYHTRRLFNGCFYCKLNLFGNDQYLFMRKQFIHKFGRHPPWCYDHEHIVKLMLLSRRN